MRTKSVHYLTTGLGLVWFMVFNATFNNISVISLLSVLFVQETGENQRPVVSHWQVLSHNVVSSTPRHERDSNWKICIQSIQLRWEVIVRLVDIGGIDEHISKYRVYLVCLTIFCVLSVCLISGMS